MVNFDVYMTESERTNLILEKSDDVIFAKLVNMYEMVDRNLEINKAEAELKVIKESGTESDLTYLISEAEEEANEKKKGILKKLIDAIREMWRKFKDWAKAQQEKFSHRKEKLTVTKGCASAMSIVQSQIRPMENYINKVAKSVKLQNENKDAENKFASDATMDFTDIRAKLNEAKAALNGTDVWTEIPYNAYQKQISDLMKFSDLLDATFDQFAKDMKSTVGMNGSHLSNIREFSGVAIEVVKTVSNKKPPVETKESAEIELFGMTVDEMPVIEMA